MLLLPLNLLTPVLLLLLLLLLKLLPLVLLLLNLRLYVSSSVLVWVSMWWFSLCIVWCSSVLSSYVVLLSYMVLVLLFILSRGVIGSNMDEYQ